MVYILGVPLTYGLFMSKAEVSRGKLFLTTTFYVLLIVASLLVATLITHKDTIEIDLLQRSRLALAQAGIDLESVQVSFEGRDGTISGQIPQATEIDKSLSVLQQVDGLRVIDNQLTTATPQSPKVQIATVTQLPNQPHPLEQTDLSAVQFKYAKAHVLPESLDSLRTVAKQMKATPDVMLQIDAHTDDSGTPLGRLELSYARALAVKETLAQLGVNPDQLIVKGYGSSKPITSNATQQGRQRNQRIELTVIR